MKNFLLKNIDKLPLFINNFFLSINQFPHLIYGREYFNRLNKLKRNEPYNNEGALIKIVNYAIDHVPYYKGLNKINTIEEFQDNIGFINKSEIFNNFDTFFSTVSNKSDYEYVTTSGSSGKPLKLLVPKNRYIIELSTMHSMWNKIGFNHHTRAVLRNTKLPSNKKYVINPITKEVIFDGFRLNEDYLFEIYETIKKLKIRYIHAYPSNAFELSKFFLKYQLDTSFIHGFLSGSEAAFPMNTELIRRTGLKFYNWYGHSEKLILGGFCLNSDYYHIENSYGYFELINEHGKVIREKGKRGEIVGSTLNNFGMPLIRYKTDDFATYVGKECPNCGRKAIIIKDICGRRNQTKIYGKNNLFVTTTALNLHDDLYDYIYGIQYVQDAIGKLDILIVKGDNFTERVETRYINHFKEKLKGIIEFNIKYVKQLKRLPNGKFTILISKIDS